MWLGVTAPATVTKKGQAHPYRLRAGGDFLKKVMWERWDAPHKHRRVAFVDILFTQNCFIIKFANGEQQNNKKGRVGPKNDPRY